VLPGTACVELHGEPVRLGVHFLEGVLCHCVAVWDSRMQLFLVQAAMVCCASYTVAVAQDKAVDPCLPGCHLYARWHLHHDVKQEGNFAWPTEAAPA
jgi:hypothetical protein